MAKNSDNIALNRKTLKELGRRAREAAVIDNSLYEKYGIARGLRDLNGIGVKVGLTGISDVVATKVNKDGETVPCAGKLLYRGIPIEELVKGFVREKRFGFEESAYLLLFGKLPTSDELESFTAILSELRELPTEVKADCLSSHADIMNVIQRGILGLYDADEYPETFTVENVVRQCLSVIAKLPELGIFAYNARKLHAGKEDAVFRKPCLGAYSTAEYILRRLRKDDSYTPLEAKILDVCLVLQAENGGGDNSAFVEHVVSSSGTDTYSALSASVAAIKGFRHGGDNVKIPAMMEDIHRNARSLSDKDLHDYLVDILDGKAYDGSGRIYGMGHAVYSVSDPRVKILRSFIKPLAIEKGMEEEYNFYRKIEVLAPEVIAEKRKIYKGVSANADFYTGFIYSMLGIPEELYTVMFTASRMVGICAHRIEEVAGGGKIITPTYVSVTPEREYIKKSERK